MTPTYYVQHPDGSYSVADPQPQQEAQAVPQPSPTAGMNIAQRILHVGGRNNAAGYVEFGSIQAVEALVRQVIRDLPEPVELENLRHNVKVYREATALTLNAAPTPPAQAVVQDHSDLYAQGWVNGTQVQSLIDWCNSGSTKRADIAFTGGPSRQIAYAIEHLVKRASNLETSEGVFVPRELLAKVANALGLPYEADHTRLRSKLLDILSFAAPAQRVMLTDEEIDALPWWTHEGNPVTLAEGLRDFARAVIEAYERKNGISQPGYAAPDMASQGASQFRAGHDAAQSEIAELEQENRLLRARNDRLQKEIEQKGER